MLTFETFQRIHQAISIIESGAIDSLTPGRHDLTEDIYVNVMEYETKESGVFESHHRFIDIHYLVCGSERIRIADENKIAVTQAYDSEGDYLLGNADGIEYAILEKHPFVVMPGEAHLPGLVMDKTEKVKKAVIKVQV